jgi:hypothetical protein
VNGTRLVEAQERRWGAQSRRAAMAASRPKRNSKHEYVAEPRKRVDDASRSILALL